MKNLSNATDKTPHQHHRSHRCRSPIPAAAVYVLSALFAVGLCVSTFILIVVHNALFFVLLLSLSTLVAAFLFWNSRNAAVLLFLSSFPDSDLSLAANGQLVKITGLVSCGNVSLESSYEKVSPCVYTSTLLYEQRDVCLSQYWNVRDFCVLWRLVYSERLSTDFYVTDSKSGIRAIVKAGPDSQVISLMTESRLIQTSTRCRVLAYNFRKWLTERNISDEARPLCLREGCIKEGSCLSVMGILHRNNDVLMIVQPLDIVSTGCAWQKLLLPVDIEGLIIAIPKNATLTSVLH